MKTIANDNNKEYMKLISKCEMLDPLAKDILSKNPTAWARIATNAFDATVKGNSISVNAFNRYISNCSFINFLEILEENKIILAVNEGNLVFLGTGDLEDILLDALFPY